jgi:CheY-like chemotaxis protein
MTETTAVRREDAPHILVVDDDAPYREALGQILQREGYTASLAPDFRGALEILESDRPVDLMLVDIVMPDRVNGVALGRMARLRRKDLKIIYVTGYNIPGIDREALGPILHKPVDEAVLLREISRVLAE